MKPPTGDHRSAPSETLELNRLWQTIVQPRPQARPEDLLIIRRADLDLFLSRLTILEASSFPPLPKSNVVARIQQAVAATFDLDLNELLSHRRTERIAWPRQIAVYLVRIIAQLPYAEIAQQFGFRDHGAAFHAVKKVKEQMAIDPRVAQLVDRLKSQFTPANPNPNPTTDSQQEATTA